MFISHNFNSATEQLIDDQRKERERERRGTEEKKGGGREGINSTRRRKFAIRTFD